MGSWALLVLLASFAGPCSANTMWVLANSAKVSPVINFNFAMEGYDAVMGDSFSNPDPGRRKQIFDPLYTDGGRHLLRSFIDEIKLGVECDDRFSLTYLDNFQQLLDERSKGYSFSFEVTDQKVPRSVIKSDIEMKQLINGGIVVGSATCVTNTVNIAVFEKPVFTGQFKNAVKVLYQSSKSPKSLRSKKTAIAFFRTFGTHFMKSTDIGSKVLFWKKIPKSVAGNMKTLENCLSTLSVTRVAGGDWDAFKTNSSHCEMATMDSDEYFFDKTSVPTKKIVVTGGPPSGSTDAWSANARESPFPVHYDLVRISYLFRDEWLDFVDLSGSGDGSPHDTDAMYRYFEDTLQEYCHEILGPDCKEVRVRNVSGSSDVAKENDEKSAQDNIQSEKSGSIPVAVVHPYINTLQRDAAAVAVQKPNDQSNKREKISAVSSNKLSSNNDKRGSGRPGSIPVAAYKADDATKVNKADDATKENKADDATKENKADDATQENKADDATQENEPISAEAVRQIIDDGAEHEPQHNINSGSRGLTGKEQDSTQYRSALTISPTTVLVTGGYSDVETPLSNLEVISGEIAPPLPDLPNNLGGHSLSAVGPVLYNCGGSTQWKVVTSNHACYTLNTTDEKPEWVHSVDFPSDMKNFHMAVAIGTQVWFFDRGFPAVFVLDTNTTKFTEHQLPFPVTNEMCIITFNNSVIAIDTLTGTIYTLDEPSQPSSWSLVRRKMGKRYSPICVSVGSSVIITGDSLVGIADYFNLYDGETDAVESIPTFVHRRIGYRLFALDGQAVVVGGMDTTDGDQTVLASIEAFNLETKQWRVQRWQLATPRVWFGLTQLN